MVGQKSTPRSSYDSAIISGGDYYRLSFNVKHQYAVLYDAETGRMIVDCEAPGKASRQIKVRKTTYA
jgi:hypothetical protein